MSGASEHHTSWMTLSDLRKYLGKQRVREVERTEAGSGSPCGSEVPGIALNSFVSSSLLSLPARQTIQLGASDAAFTSLLGPERLGGGDGERDPYLETALRWKDDMTNEFMSKELSLPAYSNFLPRFKFKKKNDVVLIYFYL